MKKTELRALVGTFSLISALTVAACSSDPENPGDGDGDGDATGGKVGTGGSSGDGDGDGDATGGKVGTGGVSGDGDGDGPGGQGGQGGEPGNTDPEEIYSIFAGKVLEVDELSGVSVASDGSIYASGTKLVNLGTEEAPVLDVHTAVVRFTSAGVLDTTFGTDGVVLLNLSDASTDLQVGENAGRELSRSIVAVPGGGAVVSINANDGAGSGGTATYLVRVDSFGELVDSFGTDGIARIHLTDWAFDTAGWVSANHPADNVWDIQLDESGSDPKIVLFGYAPAPVATTRTDNDRYVARVLLSDGSLDTSFSGDGLFSIDFGEKKLSDGTRRGVVLGDGTIVSSGYTEFPDTRHHIELLKLSPAGVPVADFSFNGDNSCGAQQDGVICSNPNLPDGGFAEAYGVAVQADGRLVTTGYGAPASDSTGTDLVSFRFDGASMDNDYATVGALIIDSGAEERGRDIVALEDGRLVHVGKYSAVAALYVTDSEGELDANFGDSGIRRYPLHDGNLFDVDAKGELIASVGGATATTAGAYFVLLRVGE